MRFGRMTTMVLGGLVLTAGPALAQRPIEASTPSRSSMRTATSQMAVSDHTLVGSVVKFDASAKRLTIKTDRGEEVVSVGTSTRVNEGPKKLSAADLASMTGYPAKVRYRDEGGRMVADSIMMSREAAKQQGPRTGPSSHPQWRSEDGAPLRGAVFDCTGSGNGV